MEIRLDKIPDERFTWREQPTVDASDLDSPDLQSIDSVQLDGTLDPTDDGWHFHGDLTYQRTLGCVRCLEPSTDTVRARIDAMVLEGDDKPPTDEELELTSNDLGVVELEGSTLDTRPLILEQIQLELPMKPLCQTDCAGLCATCGANKNHDTCECGAEVDPRWAALAALRDPQAH